MLHKFLDWFQRRVLGRSDIYFGDSLYMKRWRIGPVKWPGIRIHKICRSDLDKEMHDHPFAFLSIILWGGYWELRPNPRYFGPPPGTSKERGIELAFEATQQPYRKWYGPGSINFKRGLNLHRLELPNERPCWTLVFRGPINRIWGFQTERGWVPWQEYTANRELEASGEPGVFAAPSSLGLKK